MPRPRPSVVVELSPTPYSDRDRTTVRVLVDGELISEGDIGGEPEDNYEFRDYKWIKGMLLALATRLGSDATIVRKSS